MTMAPLRVRLGGPKHSIGLWPAFAMPLQSGMPKPSALAEGTNPFYLTPN